MTTWLALGALAQGALFLIFGKIALIPVVLLLGYRSADAYLMAEGYIRNRYMDGVIRNKFAAQIPDENGEFSGEPADASIVVFLVGLRNNHPYSILAPGFKDMGTFFAGMQKHLEENAEEYGFLGMSCWASSTQRETQNEMMNVVYFKNYDGLHKFAHGKAHREPWRWYNSMATKIPHLSIWHEAYVVPKGNWEAMYVNSHINHLAATSYKITDSEGKTKWASPVVDATKGLLRTSQGRMSRSDASENNSYAKNTLYPDEDK